MMELVCHCLLLETDNGLVLIDTGLGLQDVRFPKKRLDFIFRKMVNPVLKNSETAYEQIINLGLNPKNVSQIVLTHLHPDHIGGIRDFPNAELFVSEEEYKNFFNSNKNPTLQINSTLNWKKVSFGDEKWNGFSTGKIDTDLTFVGLKGHTKGHCGVLLRFEEKEILHCGDAYYDRMTIFSGLKSTPFLFKIMQRMLSEDYKSCIKVQKKLMDLVKNHPKNLILFSSHDQQEFLNNFHLKDDKY